VVEIQQNTPKKVPPVYYCFLTETMVKVKQDGKISAIEAIKGHLKSSSLKLKYLVELKTHNGLM